MMATFNYIPNQIYVPLGVINEAHNLAANVHCHVEKRLPWLHLLDDLPQERGSARDKLLQSGETCP